MKSPQLRQGLRALRNTNTQTRRLGYVIAIARISAQHRFLGPVELRRHIEQWAEATEGQLRRHTSASGVLRRSDSSSGSNRYIDLAQELEIITEVSGYFRNGQFGSLLLGVDGPTVEEDNPFHIRDVAPVLLYQLLRLDADYIVPLLSLVGHKHQQREIIQSAQSAIQDHLDIRISSLGLSPERASLEERFRMIRGWRNPTKYLEHLVLPRLHWMLDLGLFNVSKFVHSDEFIPNAAGRTLIEELAVGSVPSLGWLHDRFWHVWPKVAGLRPTKLNQLSAHQIQSILDLHISLAQSVLPSSIGSRIPANGLILLTAFRLIVHHNIVATFDELRVSLTEYSSLHTPPYQFYWSTGDNDGYLRLSQQAAAFRPDT